MARKESCTDDASSRSEQFEGDHSDLEEEYAIALSFFKKNKDKAFHTTYPARIRMSALSHHIKYFSRECKTLPETGLFDVVGRDIKKQLMSLIQVSRDEAIEEFIKSLRTICPEFNGFLEAKVRQAEYEEQTKKEMEELTRQQLIYEMKKKEEEKLMLHALEVENERRVEQENKLRALLNRQTLPQFKEYAAQQHPSDVKSQERLIVQLQHHHFHQYMLAVYERSDNHRNDFSQTLKSDIDCDNGLLSDESDIGQDPLSEGFDNNCHDGLLVMNGCIEAEAEACLQEQKIKNLGYSRDLVEMWCQASIDEFKSGFKDEPDSVMKIGSGEVVTIKVSGSPGGEYLIWQFATDEHDIGFGLNVVSVEDGEISNGFGQELVPILRRDSHKQVYCGRLRLHKNINSEKLCFLLRFDNSYSLWRFKWLYYRVCYSD